MLSRSFCVTQICFVTGFTAIPTALRSPDENTRPVPPFASYRITAARSGVFSTHMLQVDPIVTYIALSGPNTMDRLQCPPPPLYELTRSGGPDAMPFAPSRTRTTPSVLAMKRYPPWNARPCGRLRPETATVCDSASPL